MFAKDFIFLGHLSTPTGLRATDRMVEAISKMPTPDATGEDPTKQVVLGHGFIYPKVHQRVCQDSQAPDRTDRVRKEVRVDGRMQPSVERNREVDRREKVCGQ